MLKVAKELNIPHVYIHFIGDGRDTDPKSGAGYMQQLLDQLKEIGIGQIATIVGRYYAMDRDKRWERIKQAYDALVNGEGEEATDALQAVENSQENHPASKPWLFLCSDQF